MLTLSCVRWRWPPSLGVPWVPQVPRLHGRVIVLSLLLSPLFRCSIQKPASFAGLFLLAYHCSLSLQGLRTLGLLPKHLRVILSSVLSVAASRAFIIFSPNYRSVLSACFYLSSCPLPPKYPLHSQSRCSHMSSPLTTLTGPPFLSSDTRGPAELASCHLGAMFQQPYQAVP